MDEKRATQVSKFLSKYLRHLPQRLGLTLGLGGGAPVAELLAPPLHSSGLSYQLG